MENEMKRNCNTSVTYPRTNHNLESPYKQFLDIFHFSSCAFEVVYIKFIVYINRNILDIELVGQNSF